MMRKNMMVLSVVERHHHLDTSLNVFSVGAKTSDMSGTITYIALT
jgi:hypothetical protein